jgi:hypothetical protein
VILKLWSILALVCAVGCTSHTERADPMEIELDVFSGRPNPTWVVSPELAASVSRALSSLPAAPARPEPGHLGYRGFIIRQSELSARVFDGHVIVTTNGTPRTFADSAGLEQQLIDDARQRGFADIIRK